MTLAERYDAQVAWFDEYAARYERFKLEVIGAFLSEREVSHERGALARWADDGGRA